MNSYFYTPRLAIIDNRYIGNFIFTLIAILPSFQKPLVLKELVI